MAATIRSAQQDGPFMLKINDDGLIYSPIINLYVRLSDLQKLKEAIDLTLEVYKTEGINDLIVDQMNKEESQKEYQKFLDKSERKYLKK